MTDAAGATVPGAPREAPPAPRFEVLGAEAVRYAAAPTLHFAAHVTEPEGREVYTIALSVQVMIEPAKRSYDDATRERLVELFGEPDRWAATTRSFLWAELSLLVPAFTGATAFKLPLSFNYDVELAAAKYLYSVRDGTVPLAFNFTGTIFYRAGDGRMQIVQVPWDTSASFGLEVATWREMIDHHYPKGGWVRLAEETLDQLTRRKAERGLPTLDSTVAELLGGEER